ncbi:MAG: hypothetical protein ABIQ31_17070 [Ferruginibacter sp.]
MFSVKIQSLAGFNSTQEQFVKRAMHKFEAVMNTSLLKERILMFDTITGHGFEDNSGLTNREIYEKLMAGSETYNPEKKFQADLFLILEENHSPFFSLNPAIGFGLPGSKEITTYTWWFDKASEARYAGHIAHEWSHKVGFDHSFEPTSVRQFSVPYAFGNIIEELTTGM